MVYVRLFRLVVFAASLLSSTSGAPYLPSELKYNNNCTNNLLTSNRPDDLSLNALQPPITWSDRRNPPSTVTLDNWLLPGLLLRDVQAALFLCMSILANLVSLLFLACIIILQ